MNKKLFILALGAAMVAVSCEEKNPQIIDPEVDLIGDITENRILEEGQTYTLTGGLKGRRHSDHRARCDHRSPG